MLTPWVLVIRARQVDIFTMDKVILPVHLGIHWCCAAINFEKKQTEYYDSLGGANPQLHEVRTLIDRSIEPATVEVVYPLCVCIHIDLRECLCVMGWE